MTNRAQATGKSQSLMLHAALLLCTAPSSHLISWYTPEFLLISLMSCLALLWGFLPYDTCLVGAQDSSLSGSLICYSVLGFLIYSRGSGIGELGLSW